LRFGTATSRCFGGGAPWTKAGYCDRATVKRRYDRLAKFIPLFDRLLFLPPRLRRSAVELDNLADQIETANDVVPAAACRE